MDRRIALQMNSVLVFEEGIVYKLSGLLGQGSNSLVYKASYRDKTVNAEHFVLIKELFPYHAEGLIYRGEGNEIIVAPQAEEFYSNHRDSFIRGNEIHLRLQKSRADKTCININTYEANATLYTVIAGLGGETLAEVRTDTNEQEAVRDRGMAEGEMTESRACSITCESRIKEIAGYMVSLLGELSVFHENGFLHLDISPDNVLVLPRDIGGSPRLMLLDYNSARTLQEMDEEDVFTISVKEGYSAPELKDGNIASICPATDLFSVCAVFYRMITGRLLDGNMLYGQLPVAEEVSCSCDYPTVTAKVNDILRKGLRFSSKNRYRSCGQLIDEFKELIRRVDGTGISHAAIWESSRRGCTAELRRAGREYLSEKGSLLPCRICDEAGNTVSAESIFDSMQSMFQHTGDCETGGMTALQLTGDGGIGKTTALLLLWRKGIKEYRPKKPVPLYISLRGYAGEKSFITDALLRQLRFTSDTHTQEEARHALLQLLKQKNRVCFLLDGINEITSSKEALYKEIRGLSAYEGVSFIVTSRTQDAELELPVYRVAELSSEDVSGYLTERGLLYPEDDMLQRLLTGPMKLVLYVKACTEGGSAYLTVQSADALMDLCFHNVFSIEKDIDAYFAVHILLPMIAAEIGHRQENSLDTEALYLLCRRCRRLLQDRAFYRIYPEYTGMQKQLRKPVLTDDEWFSYMVNNLMRSRLALLTAEENRYYLIHGDYLEYFKGKYQQDKGFSQLKKHSVLKLGLRSAAVVASIAVVIIATVIGLTDMNKYKSALVDSEGVMEGKSGIDAAGMVGTEGMMANGVLNTPETVYIPKEDGAASESEAAFLTDADGVLLRYRGDSQRVVIPGSITEIGPSAFFGNTTITAVELGGHVERIDRMAFSGCVNLADIELAGVVEIGDYAFSGCQALRRISLPEELTALGSNPFISCGGLTEIFCAFRNETYCSIDGVLYTEDEKTLLSYPGGIMSELVRLNDKVQNIAPQAFSGNDYIRQLYMPADIKELDRMQLEGMANLSAILVTDGNKWFTTEEGILYTSDKKNLILCPSGYINEIVDIPEGVESIADGAFSECSSLMKVTLPESLRSIGQSAFYSCRNITEAVLNTGLKEIGAYAFYNCSSLKKVELPDTVDEIGAYAYAGCSMLTEVKLPESTEPLGETGAKEGNVPSGETDVVESNVLPGETGVAESNVPSGETGGFGNIPECMFNNCISLRSVVIPQGVISIQNDAFLGCIALESVELPEGLISIGSSFTACHALWDIRLPESLKTLGGCAFMGCISLENITIPEGIKSIPYACFMGCIGLTDVTIHGTPVIEEDAFSECPAEITYK